MYFTQLMQERRAHLYKMNFLSAEQLAENLSILLDDGIATGEEDEVILFPNEEEVMQLLKQGTLEDTSNNISNEPQFMPQQPVAAIYSIYGTWNVGIGVGPLDSSLIYCQIIHFD